MILDGRYEVDAVLGRGGMGTVYRGRDRTLDRTVAVKILAPHLAADERAVARFRREAEAAAALNHPGVVSVYDTGSQGELHYIVMEHVEGRTLAALQDHEGLLPERAAEITADVCDALQAAHDIGLVHRDVKPSNVMMTREGAAKVADFGIARSPSGNTSAETGQDVKGSVPYISPEQARGERVDARTDIYSLGCVLYGLLTGHPPFRAETPIAVLHKHVTETPVPPSEAGAEVPPALEAIVLRALAKDPEERFASAAEMARALREVVGEAVGPAAAALAGAGAGEAPPRTPGFLGMRWPIALAVAGSLVLALSVALAFSLADPPQDAPAADASEPAAAPSVTPSPTSAPQEETTAPSGRDRSDDEDEGKPKRDEDEDDEEEAQEPEPSPSPSPTASPSPSLTPSPTPPP